MDSIQDPLRFSSLAVAEDEDINAEIPLDNEPLNNDDHEEAIPAPEDPLQSISLSPPPPSAVVVVADEEEPSSSSSNIPPSFPTETSFDPLSDSAGILENVDLGQSEIEIDDDGVGVVEPLLAPLGGEERLSTTSRPVARVTISVSDPVKRVSDHSFIPGLTSSHFEYLIISAPIETTPTTTTPPPTSKSEEEAPWPRSEVRRRFNDFVSLADLLVETQRGYFIFPRPDKSALEGAAAGKSESEFVDSRRVELERYLQRLAQHPVIGRSDELKVFLTAEGSLSSSFHWQQLQPLRGSFAEGVARLPRQLLGSDSAAPTTADAAKNPKHTNDILRRLKELGERMRQEYKPPTSLPEEEITLRETKLQVECYAEVLAQASRKAEKLLREFEKVGVVTGDLGLALMRLGKYEDEEGSKCGAYTDIGAGARVIAGDSRRVGTAAIRTNRLARAATAQSVAALEPLHTELGLGPAVVQALKERESALVTVDSIREDIAKKSVALSAAEESMEVGNVKKAQNLRNEVASLEAACDAAEAEYERVKSRNQSELLRWRGERQAELKRMVEVYARVAAQFEERAADVWESVGGGGSGGGAL